jgi:hypothetical protein
LRKVRIVVRAYNDTHKCSVWNFRCPVGYPDVQVHFTGGVMKELIEMIAKALVDSPDEVVVSLKRKKRSRT